MYGQQRSSGVHLLDIEITGEDMLALCILSMGHIAWRALTQTTPGEWRLIKAYLNHTGGITPLGKSVINVMASVLE